MLTTCRQQVEIGDDMIILQDMDTTTSWIKWLEADGRATDHQKKSKTFENEENIVLMH